ncbi:hypothetical protein BE20_14285, partial [Sorangium cellulosum]
GRRGAVGAAREREDEGGERGERSAAAGEGASHEGLRSWRGGPPPAWDGAIDIGVGRRFPAASLEPGSPPVPARRAGWRSWRGDD